MPDGYARFCVPCRTDRPAKYTCYATIYRALYGVLKNKRYFAGRIVRQGRRHFSVRTREHSIYGTTITSSIFGISVTQEIQQDRIGELSWHTIFKELKNNDKKKKAAAEKEEEGDEEDEEDSNSNE